MSIKTIIQSLASLLQIHEELIVISQQKTEVVKEGSAEKLQKIVITEYKQVQKLEVAENERQQAVQDWFIQNNRADDEMTITNMLEILTDINDKQELSEITLKLTKVITQLKQQEQLNEDLLRQSLQFVQVSLNTMSPSMTNMNYGNEKQTKRSEHSVFDSKA